ncbi:glycosyl transferase family protein [Deefgea piscis]|uniref:glycosyl transferase family protein n=1 Tax=Deefgea piscis TaxID=2739061 RepID=UPI001C7F2C6C|nr:glycosyl transferase family protein [Deefgea piscis]QZA82589.1 phage adsorption protein NrfB [Deefgea piscis]
MSWLDVLAAYWFLIALLLRLGIVVIFLSSLDDFLIDCYYWVWRFKHRKSWRRSEYLPEFADDLYQDEQQAIAIMIPAWHEAPVIQRMADYAASTFDYDNYHIFVGTYPNDLETQAEVDLVAKKYPNVHKVVTRDPGPTTKADCLNNIVAFITEMEAREQIHFTCVAYHDAEDIIHPLELRAFNRLVPQFDLVQLPVMPLARPWKNVVGNHYVDEFAEWHGKDILVRQLLTGQVPSAGVGTAFSRKALGLLSEINGGVVFDTGTLTEDYEIGFRLHEVGAREMMMHYHVQFKGSPRAWFGRRGVHDMICVQEYFPNHLWQAIRQKSRWIVGIVFQGYKNLGWSGKPLMKYMLARDRKSVIAFPSLLMGYVIVLTVFQAWLHHVANPEWWTFPELIESNSSLWILVGINFFFMLNRVAQRFIFTRRYFGFWQGMQSIPRMVVGNVVNIAAFFRAFSQVRHSNKTGRAVQWDKTSHDFPDLHAGEHDGKK